MSNATKSTLVVVGGGNMGAALVGGLLAAATVDPADLSIVEVAEARREQLAIMFPAVNVTGDIPECDAAVIAVKPHDVPGAVTRAASRGATRILSIAAGVTIATLEAAAGDHVAVVRSMPNGRNRSSVRWVPWCASRKHTSMPSPVWPVAVRPTCSWWPRR